jgi:site-specific recombinase XerD
MNEITDLAKYLNRFFVEYLPLERGVSKHTIRSYSNTFTLWYEFFLSQKKISAHKVMLKDITRQNVVTFLNWLETERNGSPPTRNSRLASLRAFCYFMQYQDVKNINKWQEVLTIKAKKTEQSTVSFLTQEGMSTLLAQIPTDTIQGRRHLAILAFLYDTGARAQELISFTPQNINFSKPMHVTLYGKGKKKRIVPIHEKLCVILRAYMKDKGIEENMVGKDPLFTNTHDRILTTAGLAHIINMYASLVRTQYPGLLPEKISPHAFRHSKATHLLQAGLNIIYVRDILGHNSVRYTEIYARVDSKQKREALDNAYVDLIPRPSQDGVWEKDKELLNWLKGLGK